MAWDWMKALDERVKSQRKEGEKIQASFNKKLNIIRNETGAQREKGYINIFNYRFQWRRFKLSIKHTFDQLFEANPIVEEEPQTLPNINSPQDTKNKRIIKVDDPEEDNDAVNKGYLENGKFTGTFLAETSSKTVTVVNGQITTVA